MSVRIARRGAIAASRVQAAAGVTVVDLPGSSGNYVSTPDSAAVSITSDIDLRAKVALTDWTPAGDQIFIAKYGLAGSRNYRFLITSSGTFELNLSSDGSSVGTPAVSTAATGFVNGTAHWVRATWRNSDDRVQFFTSDDGSSWTQLGTDRTYSMTGIADSTRPVELGSWNSGASGLLDGLYYYAEIRNGIDGTVVAKYDPSAVVILGTRNPTTLVSPTGETWTMNGSAWDWATAA